MRHHLLYFKTIKEWIDLWEYSFWYERIGIVIGIILDIILYVLFIIFFAIVIKEVMK